METALFGRELYHGGGDLAARLRADMDRISELRRQWSPDLADRLYDPRSPVGRYDAPSRGVVLAENSAAARPGRAAAALDLAVDAPARLKLGSPHGLRQPPRHPDPPPPTPARHRPHLTGRAT